MRLECFATPIVLTVLLSSALAEYGRQAPEQNVAGPAARSVLGAHPGTAMKKPHGLPAVFGGAGAPKPLPVGPAAQSKTATTAQRRCSTGLQQRVIEST